VLILITSTTQLSGQIDTTGVNRLFEMNLLDLMNQKVVTASKYSQSSADAASSIGVITADEIKLYGYRTLGEALNSGECTCRMIKITFMSVHAGSVVRQTIITGSL
jgi:outer membrane receptor protein involved in Fe transport